MASAAAPFDDLLGQLFEQLQTLTGPSDSFDGATGADSGAVVLDLPLWPQLVLFLRANAFPRDIRAVLTQWEATEGGAGERLLVYVSPHITDTSRKMLQDKHVGYFDASGSLHLEWGEKLIHIERPAQRQTNRKVQSVFSGASGQVVLALLHHADQWLTGAQLAQRAGTSAFTVSKVVNDLERHEWIETRADGRGLLRRLSQMDAVLDRLLPPTLAATETTLKGYVFAMDWRSLQAALAETLHAMPDVAMTGTAAANELCPWLTAIDVVDIVVPVGQSSAMAERLGMKAVDTGHNVRLIERAAPALAFETHDFGGVSCAFERPFTVYLDTKKYGRGRSPELAERLRDRLISDMENRRAAIDPQHPDE